MSAPVTRAEHHFLATDLTEQKFVGRIAEGAMDRFPMGAGEALDLVNAGAADNA